MSRLVPVRPGLALERLIYRSRTTQAYRGPADLKQILKVAARRNCANQITGALALSDGTFIQVLEGPAARLDQLLVELNRDCRHTDLDILGRWPVSGRLFGAWAMAPVAFADASPQMHRRFHTDGLALEFTSILSDAADAALPVSL